MFTERKTTTSKRHYLNFCLVLIKEFDLSSTLRSYHMYGHFIASV